MAKKTETITGRIPADLRADLEALAKLLDRPLSWVVRRAIEQYVLQEKKDA